jgi:IclR family transcriptional regulator, KDG regulon repressor
MEIAKIMNRLTETRINGIILPSKNNFHTMKKQMTGRLGAGSSERYYVRAVERALLLLKAFLGNDADLSAGDIGRRIDLDPSTTFRMLVTLDAHGFVKQDPITGKYRLGAVCLELGSQFLRSNNIRQPAIEVMYALRDQYGETVHLGMLDRNEIVYLEKVPGLHAIGLMSSRVGGRAPAHATSIGKALLANLPLDDLHSGWARRKLARCTPATITDWKELAKECERIRENGYAIDNQEYESGVKCVAAPIFGHKGTAASISISGPVERMEEHIKKQGLIEAVVSAAARISTEIGGGRGVDQLGRLVGANGLRSHVPKDNTDLGRLLPPKEPSLRRQAKSDRGLR